MEGVLFLNSLVKQAIPETGSFAIMIPNGEDGN
jgi:hypothetical protein